VGWSRNLLFEILGPLHISGTVKARNFKFGMQIGHWVAKQKCKIMSKGVVKGSCDLLSELWDPPYLGNG